MVLKTHERVANAIYNRLTITFEELHLTYCKLKTAAVLIH